MHELPLVEQATGSFDPSRSILDSSISDTYQSPPRPLPYDDPRCSRMRHDGLTYRRDKSSSNFHEESEPLRGSNNITDMETGTISKCTGSSYEVESKLIRNKSSLKSPSTEVPNEVMCIFPLYEDEDEDVCPTCLEGTAHCLCFFFFAFFNIFAVCYERADANFLVSNVPRVLRWYMRIKYLTLSY